MRFVLSTRLLNSVVNLSCISTNILETLSTKTIGVLIDFNGLAFNYYNKIKKNIDWSWDNKWKIVEKILNSKKNQEVSNTKNEIFDYKHIEMESLVESSKNFIGTISQKPPIFSAIKKDGKRLYEYARENEVIELKERQVKIYNFQIKQYNRPYAEFIIECSKGTYIRSIANDYGKSLKSGALLYSLKRTKIGKYSLENALEIS